MPDDLIQARIEVYERLTRLTEAQFSELIIRTGIPTRLMSGSDTPAATRAQEIIGYFESLAKPNFDPLIAALDKVSAQPVQPPEPPPPPVVPVTPEPDDDDDDVFPKEQPLWPKLVGGVAVILMLVLIGVGIKYMLEEPETPPPPNGSGAGEVAVSETSSQPPSNQPGGAAVVSQTSAPTEQPEVVVDSDPTPIRRPRTTPRRAREAIPEVVHKRDNSRYEREAIKAYKAMVDGYNRRDPDAYYGAFEFPLKCLGGGQRDVSYEKLKGLRPLRGDLIAKGAGSPISLDEMQFRMESVRSDEVAFATKSRPTQNYRFIVMKKRQEGWKITHEAFANPNFRKSIDCIRDQGYTWNPDDP